MPEGLPDSIPALLRERCARYAARPAYMAFGTRLRFGRLLREAETFAAWLQAQGIQPGDRVGVLLPNCLAFPVAAFGTLLAGAVLAPLNPLYTRREIADSVRRLRPALIVASPMLATSLPEDLTCPVVGASLSDGHGWKGWGNPQVGARAFTARGVDPTRWCPSPPSHAGTGRVSPRRPRDAPGDRRVHRRSEVRPANAGKHAERGRAVARLVWGPATAAHPVRAGLTTLAALPLYHSYGFVTCALQGAAIGGCAVLIPDARRLGDIAAAWRHYPIEVFPGVNTLFRSLLAEPAFLAALARRRDDPAPLVTAGGMPLAEATAAAWKAKAGYPILQGYGSTETTSTVSCTEPGVDYDGCVGPPLAGTRARICNPAGESLPVGQVGELQIRGEQVSPGYWDGAEAGSHTADGWFRTGDFALQEVDGRLRLMGRLKELVIVSGFNVYPAEIEAFIQQHPAVAECAAIGVADERTGEAVVLFIVLRPDGLLEEVKRFAREGLTAYKRPRHCLAVDAMPKTPIGKIVKAKLAPLVETSADAHRPASEELQ